MNELPESLKVGPYTVKVRLVKNLMMDNNSCGEYNPRTKTIDIDDSLCPEQQYGTFCHEIIEAFTEIWELESLQNNHHDIVLLGEALHGLLRDNRETVLPK